MVEVDCFFLFETASCNETKTSKLYSLIPARIVLFPSLHCPQNIMLKGLNTRMRVVKETYIFRVGWRTRA